MNESEIYETASGEDHATKKPRIGNAASPAAVDDMGEHFAFSSPSIEHSTEINEKQEEVCEKLDSGIASDAKGDETAISEAVEEESRPCAEQEFEEISAQMRQSSVDTKDLDIYEKGSAMRREAVKRLALEFSQFEKGLENNLENFALQKVVHKYDEVCASNDKKEETIRNCFISNHAKRTKLHEILQTCDEGWKQCSENMNHQINGQAPVDSETAPLVRSPDHEGSDAQDRKGMEEGPVQEPDWETLKMYEPSRADIESFLAGRHRLQLAQERFCQAYEEVQRSLISINDEVTKILVTSIDSLDVPINQMENQLQYLLADNFVRRQNMETKIQEAAHMQQGIFSDSHVPSVDERLMSHVMFVAVLLFRPFSMSIAKLRSSGIL